MFHQNQEVKIEISTQSDPIKHVVLLMMENHSFDQMLGCFQQKYPDLEGVDPMMPRFNLDNNGNKIFQKATTEKQMALDPLHEVPDVLAQINGNNSGFVKNFIANYPKSSATDHQNIMGYYPLGFLPALHALADEFVICDHWFSSLPGPTWPNRNFALSGTTSGRVKMPTGITDPNMRYDIFYQNQTNIFDCLDKAGKSWRNYYSDFPLSLVLTHQREPHNLINYHQIDRFFKDANGAEADFPEFTFIEPKYMGTDQNDDHPPHNTMKAEKLIADVYNAIRSNKKLWESTLFVITYDEHGGFYDHVPEPDAIPPDAHQEEYTFDKLGVRVPALLISPWLKKGVEKTVFDHTSLLKYLIDKWQLDPLGERTRHANSIAVALKFAQEPRQDCISHIFVPTADLISSNTEIEKWNNCSNHQAIHVFADFLSKNKNIQTTSILPSASKIAAAKEKVGSLLVKCGMWCQKNSYEHRQARIMHSSEIAATTVESKPADEVMQDDLPASNKSTVSNNQSFSRLCC